MTDRMLMRSSITRPAAVLATALALSACGGGGGASAPAAPLSAPTAAPTTAPSAGYVTPKFTIVVPAAAPASVRGRRAPQFVSTGTQSITITITNPPAGLTPTSVTTNISGASCAGGCTVNGPPSPPGQNDQFSLTTFDAPGGVGNPLDTGQASLVPVVGQANSASVTMQGIPASIVLQNPASLIAGTAGQSEPFIVTVKDHAGETITGTYANPVTITDPDSDHINGTSLNATIVFPLGAAATLLASTDTLSLVYNGLAENPVTFTSSAGGVSGPSAGTATFTPTLQPVSWVSGPTSLAAGSPKGIDLFTSDSTSNVGYTGTESYSEPGFTNAPYNKQLGVTGASACAAFATLATGPNSAGATPFTATSIASPVAGLCTLTVTDNLTDQPNTLPTFVVTYTTSSVGADGKRRR